MEDNAIGEGELLSGIDGGKWSEFGEDITKAFMPKSVFGTDVISDFGGIVANSVGADGINTEAANRKLGAGLDTGTFNKSSALNEKTTGVIGI